MGIYTNTGSFIKVFNPNTAKGPRNKHLVPEVSLRAQRILRRAAEEENQAFTVHPIYTHYYKRLTHGKQCTCRIESLSRDSSKTALNNSMQLADFLVNVPQILPTKDNCPICFDSGFVGGYSRLGAFTITLDSTTRYTTSKVRLEKKRPYIFRPSDKAGYVNWEIKIPKYFKSVLDVAVRWDIEPKEWDLKIEGNLVDEDNIIAEKNSTANITLSMKDGDNLAAGAYCVFIVLEVADSNLLPANFPNISTSLTADYNVTNEITSPQSVYLDNSIQKVDTTDLFIDTRFRRVWRILEIEHNAPFNEPIDWKTSARLVRDFEATHMVPNKLIVSKYPISGKYTFVV